MWNGMCTIEIIEDLKIKNFTKKWGDSSVRVTVDDIFNYNWLEIK